MNRKTHSRRKKKISQNTKTFIAALSFGLLSLLVFLITKYIPSFTNGIYSRWSIKAMQVLSKVFSFASFSIAEVLIYLLSVGLLIYIIFLIRNMVKYKNPGQRFVRFIAILLLIASIGAFSFYGLWGGMYYSKGLDNLLRVETKDRYLVELIELNKHLLDKANTYSKAVTRNEQGYFTGYGFDGYATLSAQAASLISGKNEENPKYVISSEAWSYTMTTGIFTFLTGEANVNKNDLAISLPFTCTHEIAHRNGITSEDEANFFAFYSLINSDNLNLKYSAYSMALLYSMNSLYSKDKDTYMEIRGMYSEELSHDYKRYHEHWAQYEGKVAEISSKTNDLYLKAQGQKDGVASYGRVTDLLLWWHEQEIVEGKTIKR